LQSDAQPDLAVVAVSLLPLQHDADFDISQLAIFDLSQFAILHLEVSPFASQFIDVLQHPAFESFIAVAVDAAQHLPVAVTSVVAFLEVLFPSCADTTRTTPTARITTAERPISTFFILSVFISVYAKIYL
jgi:hypothetical protein